MCSHTVPSGECKNLVAKQHPTRPVVITTPWLGESKDRMYQHQRGQWYNWHLTVHLYMQSLFTTGKTETRSTMVTLLDKPLVLGMAQLLTSTSKLFAQG